MPDLEKISSPARGGQRPGAGRPRGVPNRLTRDIKALASRYGPDALETLVRIMNEGESEQARIAAAKELLDRGYGRPAQALELYRGRSEVRVIVDRSAALPVENPPGVALLENH